jgi:hypothetical protein
MAVVGDLKQYSSLGLVHDIEGRTGYYGKDL